MKVGIVVLTYNRPDALLAVLTGLAPQCAGDVVLVIADDGSNAHNVDLVRKALPALACPVHHIWHPDIGFTAARARNLGARTARNAGADYLIFLDGDCVPSPHFLRAHLALARPQRFVNGSRVLLSENLSNQVVAGRVELLALGAVGWFRLRLAGDVNKLTHLVYWPASPGREQENFVWKGIRSCNFGVWYRDFEAVNGFDESFQGWGHEDADLVLRLHHLGAKRTNGFLATEVLHLWHHENSRADEAGNRDRVVRRMSSAIVRAELGLAELEHGGNARLGKWN